MKKAILILLTLALSTVTLVGCGATQTAGDSSTVEVKVNAESNPLVGTWYTETSDALVAYQFLSDGTALTTILKNYDSQYYFKDKSSIRLSAWRTYNNIFIASYIYSDYYYSEQIGYEYAIENNKLTLTCYERINPITRKKTSQILNRYDGNIFALLDDYMPNGSIEPGDTTAAD
ncbi:MAG: hypothetical protein IJY93_05305 [Clostridia bacterium]|nr:hypothetical protein [Clostridia bacterium]